MFKLLTTRFVMITVAGSAILSGCAKEMPNKKEPSQTINEKEKNTSKKYYGYKDLKSLALDWYDKGYTNLNNPKNIPTDKVNGLPLGLSKDDYVQYVEDTYGKEAGNKASTAGFVAGEYYGYKDLKSLALAWYDKGYTNRDNPEGIPVDPINGLPIGLSKDDYVKYVVDKYGEENGNSASQTTFIGGFNYYGYKDLRSLALAWYDKGYTNMNNPKGIPVDRFNGLPIGLSKDDYVKYVVAKYGEKQGNSASQTTFIMGDYYGYKDLKSLALAWYDKGYTNLKNPEGIPVDPINGLPLGLSKDDYVKYVVDTYGEEKVGNSASQTTFISK